MVGRRDAIKMSDDEISAFLEAGRDLQVASINADGTPHLVTMWYAMQDGEIAFWTYGKSQKIMNLRRDPRLSVLVATGEVYEQLKGVSIQGQAEIVDDPDDALREGVQAMGAKRVVIVVKPEKILSWDHSKLGGAY